jgi:phage terminase large subunit
MEKRIKVSKVFGKIRKSDKRIIVNEGSSRSTKTYSILQYIISEHLQYPKLVTTICRAKLTWLKVTVVPDFIEIMQTQFDLWNDNHWNKTESAYSINGGLIRFIGLDETQKMHGLKQDIFWINEAVETRLKDFRQLIIRTKKKAILDYNPSYEQHWIYDKVIPREDCEFIKSTYKDNPFLEKEIIEEIERLEPNPFNDAQGTSDEVSWKIYGLGERAAHKGLIFAKVKICSELPPQDEWKDYFYGLDFGFTNDPTALTLCVIAHGNLYLKELIYKRGLTNIINKENPNQPSIQQCFIDLGIKKQDRIWADAAEPKSIMDLFNCGYNIKAASKGPGSVNAGIDAIKRHNVFITEDSLNGIKEKNNYKWREDNSGNLTNVPIEGFDHFWDSTRYGLIMETKKEVPSMGVISLSGASKWIGH